MAASLPGAEDTIPDAGGCRSTQTLPMRGRQLPHLLHQLPVMFGVEYLGPMVLNNVDWLHTVVAAIHLLEALHHHAKCGCVAPPYTSPS